MDHHALNIEGKYDVQSTLACELYDHPATIVQS